MIIDAAQLLHFKAVLGVTDRNNGLLERHATLDVVDRQEEACAVWDVDCVHFVVIIKLEELHRVTFQCDLLIRLFADPLHVHVVVLLVLIIDLINTDNDLIIITIEQFFDDDINDWQQDNEMDGVLVGVDVHVHRVCALDFAIKVYLLALDRKFIILLPCLSMLL
jgi:hypothetical protein